MTGNWLTLTEAARRISEATDVPVSVGDIKQLGKQGDLKVRYLHEHYSVLEDSITSYLSRLAAHGGDDQTAPVPSVGGGPSLPLEIEADYERRKDHDDTPNDEGDE